MEHILKKYGAIPIPAKTAQEILSDKPFISLHQDNYHSRLIGGEEIEKMMFGNIENVPQTHVNIP